MEEIFNILTSSARIDKTKRKKRKLAEETRGTERRITSGEDAEEKQIRSRDRTGKRDTSDAKRAQVHKEKIAAFRKSMKIKVADKHDADLPDPISYFEELSRPSWWIDEPSFLSTQRAVQRNIETGKWKEPKPIQMQSIPVLLKRRDLIGAAPTGSGKSGSFIIPAVFLSAVAANVFYGNSLSTQGPKRKNKKRQQHSGCEGEIRALILAPSLELAAQLHREVERLGIGKPGGLTSLLLSKSNSSQVINRTAGGKSGLDILVATPMRLVDAIEKGVQLDTLRLVVLDEADRLLDASDGVTTSSSVSDKDDVETKSGSAQSKTFLSQMDTILTEIPSTATRALFSATVTPMVRSFAESILRNPVDITIAGAGVNGGANADIDQKLMFVGKEQGKLLAVRQLVQRGELRPPAIMFLESKDRAQALFNELLYDGIQVDVIHAGRSKSAREKAVSKFRRGDTWLLICTDLVARGVDFRAVNMVINYDLPSSGIDYVHRIGRTGRAGRKGVAVTLFTEADFDNLRTIANVMKQSGCKVEDWMLNMSKRNSIGRDSGKKKRPAIDTTPSYDRRRKRRRQDAIKVSKKRKDSSKADDEN